MIWRLVAVAAGVWLMFAPAVLEYGPPAADVDRTLGPTGAAFAFVAMWQITRGLRWMTAPIGLMLIVAPVVLGYDDTAAVLSSVTAGTLMAGSAPFGGAVDLRTGEGWHGVLPGGGRWRVPS